MKLCVIGSYAKALVMTTERIPLSGETLIGDNFRGTFGGKGSDMAVQAARLDASVNFLGVVGDDSYGKEFIDLLNEEKINSQGLRVDAEKPTGVGFIVKDIQGNNVIVVDMGANETFEKADIDTHLARILEADVVLAQLEVPLETALYALKKAKERGKTTILNPAPAVSLLGQDLSYVDYLTPNETEAQVVLGQAPTAISDYGSLSQAIIAATKCKNVVMTLGSEGVYYRNASGGKLIPPFEVKAVDSNGAGDSFNAAFAVGLGRKMSVDVAIIFASATAALCCTEWETVPSYHNLKEVENFIENEVRK